LQISNLYIDKSVLNSTVVEEIRSRFDIPAITVESIDQVYKKILKSDKPVELGKRTLILSKNRGAFVRNCPGTESYTCCNYLILHVGTFCPMDCSYCILQSYFHPPVLQYFVNHEDISHSLLPVFKKNKVVRIGTGEYTDSLIWEMIDTDAAKRLINIFAEQSCAVLELKTKTININNLLNLSHNRKTVISWSLNTPKIIKSEERGTASLNSRLKAAAKCAAAGYPLGFHLDPLVIYPGCEMDYQKVINQLFSVISPENIVWLSLGTFRFMPSLKDFVETRFKDSRIIYGEFIRGLDGKMRYFKPLRIKLYQQIVSYIQSIAPDVVVYFCMEDDEVWKKTLGFTPDEKGGLPNILDKSAARHCALQGNF